MTPVEVPVTLTCLGSPARDASATIVVQSPGQRTTRVLSGLGWLSYPLYCVHFPIFSIFTSIVHDKDFGLPTVLSLSAFSILIACIAAKAFDEPIRSWLSSAIGKKQSLQIRAPDH